MINHILYRQTKPAVILALVFALTATAYGQPRSPIAIVGQGVLKSISQSEGEKFAVALDVRSSLTGPVRVHRAETFLVCEGGWSVSLGEQLDLNRVGARPLRLQFPRE